MVVGVARPAGPVRLGFGGALYLPLPDAVDARIHRLATDSQAPLAEDAADFLYEMGTRSLNGGSQDLDNIPRELWEPGLP